MEGRLLRLSLAEAPLETRLCCPSAAPPLRDKRPGDDCSLAGVPGWIRICTKQGGEVFVHLRDRVHIPGAFTVERLAC
ncbi:hypothetical protein MHYP_G00135740 [Metynnis hypsauchen]